MMFIKLLDISSEYVSSSYNRSLLEIVVNGTKMNRELIKSKECVVRERIYSYSDKMQNAMGAIT